MRTEQAQAIAEIELKLNKSYLLLTTELDNLRDPLVDMLQDIDKQRVAMMKELERTKLNNRKLSYRSQQLSPADNAAGSQGRQPCQRSDNATRCSHKHHVHINELVGRRNSGQRLNQLLNSRSAMSPDSID